LRIDDGSVEMIEKDRPTGGYIAEFGEPGLNDLNDADDSGLTAVCRNHQEDEAVIVAVPPGRCVGLNSLAEVLAGQAQEVTEVVG